MNISDCKGCKVESVGHDLYNMYIHCHDTLMLLNRWNVYLWKCNRCQYESLRFSDKDNTEQFYPIEPHGKDLDAKIPENIRKDFNEARKIGELSPRCGNVLLRTCLEGLCNWIAEELLEDDKKAGYPKEYLNRKIEYIQKHITFVSDNPFVQKMMEIIKAYGNDIHAHQKIDDSDTLESFNAMQRFIESICDKILSELKDIETVNEYHQKIPEKIKT